MKAEAYGYENVPYSNVSYYSLDYQKNGKHNLYIWRHHPNRRAEDDKLVFLIDLKGIFLPESEIEKMIMSLALPGYEIHSIAFANCNQHNQQVIKRKLKAQDVRLYSNTFFFAGLDEARQWLHEHTH